MSYVLSSNFKQDRQTTLYTLPNDQDLIKLDVWRKAYKVNRENVYCCNAFLGFSQITGNLYSNVCTYIRFIETLYLYSLYTFTCVLCGHVPRCVFSFLVQPSHRHLLLPCKMQLNKKPKRSEWYIGICNFLFQLSAHKFDAGACTAFSVKYT